MSIRVTIVGEFDFRQIQQAQRELDAAARQLETFGTRVRRAGEQFGKAGRQMQTVGRNLTKYVTLPIVGLGAAALKSSSSPSCRAVCRSCSTSLSRCSILRMSKTSSPPSLSTGVLSIASL